MSSAAACCFCMIMISSMLAWNITLVGSRFQQSKHRNGTSSLTIVLQQAQWVFVGFTFLFFDFFSLGILPVSWMYASEIMPLRTRNKGVALGAAAHWLSNFVIVYVTPQAIQSLGYRLYIIWALLNAIFVPITWLFYPETAGRSLEEMDAVFLNERFGVTKTRTPAIKTRAGHDAPTTRD